MKKTVRASLFWGIVIIFLIFAPLLVLYTFGFRYNFKTSSIERTGIVSITTIPKGADVFVNDKLNRSDTPTLLRQLLPRKHRITLSKDEYHSWEKDIEAISKETVFLESIVLWKDAEPEMQETRGEVHLVNPTKTALVSLESSGVWTEAWVENFQKDERVLVGRFAGTLPEFIGIQWSPDGEYLLLSNNKEEILVTKQNGDQQINIKEFIPLGLDSLWWDEGRDHSLIATTRSRTMRLDVFSGETEILLSEPVSTILSVGDELYYTIPRRGSTHVILEINDEPEVIAILPTGTYHFVSSRLPYLLLFNETRNRIVLLDANIHDEPILLNTEATQAFWKHGGGYDLLYTNDFETHIFNPENLEDKLITRVSDPITAITWHPSGASVVLTHPNGIIAYDLHEPGYVQTKLNEAQNIDRVFIDDKGRSLYFLGAVNGEYGLYKQELR